MPKLAVHLRSFPPARGGAAGVAVLSLEGSIDSASQPLFERQLESVCDEHRYVVLDFRGVRSIHSSGIGALIRSFEGLRSGGGELCLAHVSREVGLAMHLLGVTSLIAFHSDVAHARSHLHASAGRVAAITADDAPPADDRGGDDFAEPPPDADSVTPPAPTPVPLRRRSTPNPEHARVLVVMPERGRLTRVLRLRFRELEGDYRLVHSTRQALGIYDGMSPALVVVHHQCDPRGDFVEHIKARREQKLTSIVKLYADEKELAEKPKFKIWENDYLVEPFEVLELFTLTEAELERLQKDGKVLRKQLHLEFCSERETVERAYQLLDGLLRQVVSVPDDATALYAAVKEAVDNAVIHGHEGDPARRVQVHFLVDHRKITLIIEDEGKGFDFDYYVSRLEDQETFERAKRRILEENGRAGLGILLMSRCVDRLEYAENGNILRLEKNL